MDKMYLICKDCEHEYTIEFDFVSDALSESDCPKCKSPRTFIRDIKYENEIDGTPLGFGGGGCGRCGSK